MDFNFTEEQQLIQESVERFIQDEYDFATRRKLAASDDGFSRDNWATFAELGWLGVSFPEEAGGFGGGPVETMIVMEAFGKGLVTEPYLPTVVLAGGLVARHGSDAQKADILPSIVDGSLMMALAFAEPQSRFTLADVATKAEAAGDGFALTGHKAVVFNAASAGKLIVSARNAGDVRDRDGVSLFLVDGDADGLTRRDYRTVDGLRASEVMLDGVTVGADAVIGPVGGGLPLLEEAVDYGTVAVCAEAVGAMKVLHDTTHEYLKTRQQFGQPIGKFQVLQHRMVDMFIHYEEAKSMALMATLRVGEDAESRARAVSAAKVQIGKSARFIGQESVQLHGGMGMTDELSVGSYFKRLTMIEALFGNTDYHLNKFAAG